MNGSLAMLKNRFLQIIKWMKNMPNDIADLDQGERLRQLESLFWLADAPLFIDEELVERFFDAIVRPKFEHVDETQQVENETETKILGHLGLTGTIGLHLPAWLKPIKAEVEAKGGGSAERTTRNNTSSISQLKPIWNSERQLEELARHYLAHHRDRLIAADRPMDSTGRTVSRKWYDAPAEYFTKPPRALAFLDISPGVELIPTAAEFADGTIALLYEELVGRLTTEKGGPARKYPESNKVSANELRASRKAYWASFQQYYDSKSAMLVIEQASAAHGRISWIDFRLPLDSEGTTLHLHIVPAAKFSAGTFGYNFARRAHKHGVRIVGTLKSEPDMNVLAVYEK
ncbi:MAG TPA: hypothetical protein VGL35_02085 [Rhizomicrobium sp.]|jgi:hypothetical protein